MEPVPGFGSDCSVTVRYDDGTIGTVSAAERPKSMATSLVECIALPVGYGALWLLSAGDSGSSWKKTVGGHKALLAELHLALKGEMLGEEAPPSGEYWGSSEESDEGDQAVRCTLSFGSDGTVTGRGTDGVDGAYRITRGGWGVRRGDSKLTVAWVEVYDEGFQVAVEGHYDAHNGKIEARFTSSRGVIGSFVLAPKPIVF